MKGEGGGGREGGREGERKGGREGEREREREEGREGGRERGRKGEGRSKRRYIVTGFGRFFPLSTYTHLYTVLYSPIEIERGGRKREILHDHNDMYILHFCKNLIT